MANAVFAGTNGDVTILANTGDITINTNIRCSALSGGDFGDGAGTLGLTATTGGIVHVGATVAASGTGGSVNVTAA